MVDYILTTSATLNVTGRTAAPLVIIGGGCPTKTEEIAKLSKLLHGVQVQWSGVVHNMTCNGYLFCTVHMVTCPFCFHKLTPVIIKLNVSNSCVTMTAYVMSCNEVINSVANLHTVKGVSVIWNCRTSKRLTFAAYLEQCAVNKIYRMFCEASFCFVLHLLADHAKCRMIC